MINKILQNREYSENLKKITFKVGIFFIIIMLLGIIVFMFDIGGLATQLMTFFEETIEKDIAFGPNNLGLSSEEVSNRVKKSMEMVGLDYEAYRNVSPFDLSGGQKRRVAIAGVIAMEPKVLILDEPTAGLDPKGRDDILEQIKILHKKYKMTIVLVSHSMEDVANLAERIVVMNKGKIALLGKPAEVFKNIDILESIGLAVPQVTYLMKALREKGFEVSDNIFTIEQGKDELLKILLKK